MRGVPTRWLLAGFPVLLGVLALGLLAGSGVPSRSLETTWSVVDRSPAGDGEGEAPPEVTAERGLPLIPPREPGAPVFPPGEATSDGPGAADPAEAHSAQADPAEVARVQSRLADLRYYAGEVDGRLGPATTTALQAFQKVQGLPVDGRIGPETLGALAAPVGPRVADGAPDRIQIDLDTQVMVVHLGGLLERIMPISSGNGEPYLLPGGARAQALTPAGTFTIQRRVRGQVDAHFGRLSDPMYFHEGWAIHGSGNVPAIPASHGCVRLPRPDAAWLFEQADVGMQVLVFGERNAFHPALGESAGTDTPAGDPGPPEPVEAPPAQGFS